MPHFHWRGRVAPLPLEREGSSVLLERDGGPLPFHRRVAPLPLKGEDRAVVLERNGGPLPLHRKCGPLQLEGESHIAIGGRAHCHWIGKVPFANDKIMIYYNIL